MQPLNLLGICCNWSPYACYLAAGRAELALPESFKLMRVMCIGRINQALILRAFEHGADGVIILECVDADCRYGPGPEVGHTNVARVRRLLRFLGIGQERLLEAAFAADQRDALVSAVWDFDAGLKALAPSPARPASMRAAS
jgi:coenzyme F420-reducing hydrogenase delta subunit